MSTEEKKFEELKKELGLKANQVTAAIKKYNASSFDECMQALRSYHQFKYPHLYESCDHCQGDGVLDAESGDPGAIDSVEDASHIENIVEEVEGKRLVGHHPVTGEAVYK